MEDSKGTDSDLVKEEKLDETQAIRVYCREVRGASRYLISLSHRIEKPNAVAGRVRLLKNDT